jgi:hypothetical protein
MLKELKEKKCNYHGNVSANKRKTIKNIKTLFLVGGKIHGFSLFAGSLASRLP